MIDLRRILVPVDFSRHSEQALIYGSEFARRFNADLFLLHVFQDLTLYQPDAVNVGPPVLPPLEELTAAQRRSLERLAMERKLNGIRVTCDVVEGTPVEEIVEYAEEKGIDLIVVGTRGRGWLAHAFLGSTAEKLVRKAPCPVLTVRLQEHEFVKPVVAPG